jgi:hypothetical protein
MRLAEPLGCEPAAPLSHTLLLRIPHRKASFAFVRQAAALLAVIRAM